MDEHGQRIREFLLGFVESGDTPGGTSRRNLPEQLPSEMDLRAEIEQHDVRPLEDRSDDGAATTNPCAKCRDKQIQPCSALRLLALQYAEHPAYRKEWHPSTAQVIRSAPVRVAQPIVHDRTIPPPYPVIADLPGPGAVRRRLLRQAGLNISMRDFTEQEWDERHWARDDPRAAARVVTTSQGTAG